MYDHNGKFARVRVPNTSEFRSDPCFDRLKKRGLKRVADIVRAFRASIYFESDAQHSVPIFFDKTL